MRERIQFHDSMSRRSSLSRVSDCEGNDSSRINRRDVSSRYGRSPVQIDAVSRGFEVRRTDREQDVDRIRHECEYSALEVQIRDGFSQNRRREEGERDYDERYRKHSHLQEDTFSGKHYPIRCETVQHGLGSLIGLEEELYWRHDAEPSRLGNEPRPSRFITSHDYEYSPSHRRNLLRNDKTDRLESISRDYSDSSLLNEDGRDRGIYMQAPDSSPLSQVGSSGTDSRCCIRVNDSDRVDERRRQDYSGNLCASQVLQTRHLDDYVGRNSPRDQPEKYFRNLNCSGDFNRGDHDSPAVSRCGKEIVDESCRNYQRGSDIAMREFPSVKHDVKNMARERDLLMQASGSLSKSYVCGSNVVDVDATDSHLEFCTEERMTDQYDFVKEHYPFVELGSRVVNERDDKDHHYRNFRNEERKVVYLDNKCQLLRKDYQYDGVDRQMYLHFIGPDVVVDRDRDDKAPHSISLCLNKEREAYLDNERTVVYSDDKRGELRHQYDIGNDGWMHSDVDGVDNVVDQDGRVVKLQLVCLNRGKAAYLDNEKKDVYLNYKGQQLEKDYDSRTDARIYHDVNGIDILVDREDARGVRFRGVSLNDRKEAYMQYEREKLLKDHETASHGMMHPNLNESYILVDREDARALELRRVSFDDGKESYLRYESQQLKKDYDYGTDDRIYRDVNCSNIIVDHGDAKALELRRVTFSDRNEAHLDNESKNVYQHYKIQQLKKDYDSGIDDRMYPDVTKSEIVVDQGGARAPELRGISLNDGREAYLHYESQKLLRDHEIDSYGMMHLDVSRSSVGKQDEEISRCKRYIFDDQNQVCLDYERLQLHDGVHLEIHANMRYPDGRREVYHSNDEILLTRDDYGPRDEASEVIHEKMADDYNYSDVKQLGMSYEKADSERFHEQEVAYDYRDKLGNYAVDVGPITEQFRYLVDERNFGNVDHTSTPRPRISAKERLGGRVNDSNVHVKNRVLHRVRNPKLKGKSQKRNQNFFS